MSITSFDLGSHIIEIDTTHGEVVIASSGLRQSLSHTEASNLFSALLAHFLPSQFIQDKITDPLQVNVLRSETEKYERVMCHTSIMIARHLVECGVCSDISTMHDPVLISHRVAVCISESEDISPYLTSEIVTYKAIQELALTHITPAYISQRLERKCYDCGIKESETTEDNSLGYSSHYECYLCLTCAESRGE